MGEEAFPKYLIWIGGKQQKFLSHAEAVASLDGDSSTFFGQYVLQEDFSVSLMTDADRLYIAANTGRQPKLST